MLRRAFLGVISALPLMGLKSKPIPKLDLPPLTIPIITIDPPEPPVIVIESDPKTALLLPFTCMKDIHEAIYAHFKQYVARDSVIMIGDKLALYFEDSRTGPKTTTAALETVDGNWKQQGWNIQKSTIIRDDKIIVINQADQFVISVLWSDTNGLERRV